jgi:hypothetical protein
MLYSDLPYVGFAMHRRATVKTHLYFKRLMIKQMIYVKKKKKKGSSQLLSVDSVLVPPFITFGGIEMTYYMIILLVRRKILVKQVKWEVRSRVLARCSAKKIMNSARLDQKWSLQPLVSS